MIHPIVLCTLVFTLMTGALPVRADKLRVAVASNFRPALAGLAESFEAQSGHQLTIISGSTGKHYAQIRHGAPFDVFLAADSERPARLEAEGAAIRGSRITYALGRLVLWSRDEQLVDAAGRVLLEGSFRRLAIANPSLAPYGRAAREALQSLHAWEQVEQRLVRGENIAQAFQFAFSGNAELGLIAAAQSRGAGGSHWPVPGDLHTAIEQQAVLLQESPAGLAFMAFLVSPGSRSAIRQYGYDTPP